MTLDSKGGGGCSWEENKENVDNSSASSGQLHSQKIVARNVGLLHQITRNECTWSHQEQICAQFPSKCMQLLGELELNEAIGLHEFSNLPELFAVVQEKGLLNGKILKYFSQVPGIVTLNYTPSYGQKLCNAPYRAVVHALKDPKNCTIPLYRGYGQLEMLDLNNVDITDNELRFIIRLSNLKALGLGWTKISCSGLAFLAEYATFVSCLECLMLGGNDALAGDAAVHSICKFVNLLDLDVAGTGISLPGVRKLGKVFGREGSSLSSIRISESIASFLQAVHIAFHAHQWKTWQDSEVAFLERQQVVEELMLFGNSYGEFSAYQNTESLKAHLMQIMEWRRSEEFIWSILRY